MLWISTPSSVEARRPTVLAVVETILALGVAILFVGLVTPKFWLAWCSLVPFMLLRTDRATRLGQSRYRKLHDMYEAKWGHIRHDSSRAPRLILVGGCAALRFGCVMLWLRIAILMRDIYRNPVGCIRSVPANWLRVVLCVDLAYSPEIITGQNLVAREKDAARFFYLAQSAIEVFRTGGISTKFLVITLGSVLFVIAYLPSLLFRVAVKSTCIVWLGLLWGSMFTHISNRRIGPLKSETQCANYCRLLVADPLLKASVLFSMAVIVLVFAKVAQASVPLPDQIFGSRPIATWIREIVAPDSVPPWQWASCVVSAATVCAVYLATREVNRNLLGATTDSRAAVRKIVYCQAVIWTLRAYVISCTLYITWQVLSVLKLPPLGDKIAPWL